MNFKVLLVGACAVAAMGAASTASATMIDITGAGIYSSNQLKVNGVEEYASVIDLSIKGSSDPFFVFCVDLDHEISINIGSQHSFSPGLAYVTDPVKTNSNGFTSGTGSSISLKQSGEIQTLANIGIGIADKAGISGIKSSSTTQAELTAIQGAIWEVEYSLKPSQVKGTSTENMLIKNYITYADENPGDTYAAGIYAEGKDDRSFGMTQGFVISDAPEPATWAIMLVGFGGLGAGVRMSRRRSALA